MSGSFKLPRSLQNCLANQIAARPRQQAGHHKNWPRRETILHTLQLRPRPRPCEALAVIENQGRDYQSASIYDNHRQLAAAPDQPNQYDCASRNDTFNCQRYAIQKSKDPHRIQAVCNPFCNGSARTRLPVAAKTALARAGKMTALGGSPMPPGFSWFSMIVVWITGASFIRNTR